MGQYESTKRTSLSLYPNDRDALATLAQFLFERGFAYSLALAFRAALHNAKSKTPLPDPEPPKEGMTAEPLTMQFAGDEHAQLRTIALKHTAKGERPELPAAARRVIHAARTDKAFIATATALQQLDQRRARN